MSAPTEMHTREVYSRIAGKLDNCGYIDPRTIEGALGAVVDLAKTLLSNDEIRTMVQRRLEGAPYPEGT